MISIGIALCALLFTAASFRRTQNKDTSSDATERATMSADLRYIRQSIDEIKLENKAIQRDIEDLKTRVVVIEQSTKRAHERLDDIKNERG